MGNRLLNPQIILPGILTYARRMPRELRSGTPLANLPGEESVVRPLAPLILDLLLTTHGQGVCARGVASRRS